MNMGFQKNSPIPTEEKRMNMGLERTAQFIHKGVLRQLECESRADLDQVVAYSFSPNTGPIILVKLIFNTSQDFPHTYLN